MDYLARMAGAGVAHVLLNIVRGARPALDLAEELGREVLPLLCGQNAALAAPGPLKENNP